MADGMSLDPLCLSLCSLILVATLGLVKANYSSQAICDLHDGALLFVGTLVDFLVLFKVYAESGILAESRR
ncbi:hypothetical protein BDV37DRAFT_229312 [Aspergillus pseudonomiae]|uniref:Uncharacterized protein n=1 Tax=Aspergillus pseudonomiae TaxID=1506151 RepID=A0A5N7CZD5_9EURO|nr:uncharacterized protein BDV37DRAFT_229312 [Aspergillus pseudonomiae]KAE8399522.1 hypothetical protein BDV37DRAFT_229312 [Aspergillus pseudonomiae]